MRKYRKKIFSLLFLAGALLLTASGCAHTSTLEWQSAAPGETSSSGKRVLWRLNAANNGMFLFYWIPVWTGYATRPNRHEYKFFENDLTSHRIRRTLDRYLEEMGAEAVEDFKWSETASGWLGLGIIWKRSIYAEGVAVTTKPEKKERAGKNHKKVVDKTEQNGRL